MKRFGRAPRAEQLFRRVDGAGRVVGELGRNFQRDPSVDSVGPVVNRTKEVGGARQVFEREFEEQRLALLAAAVFSRIAAS